MKVVGRPHLAAQRWQHDDNDVGVGYVVLTAAAVASSAPRDGYEINSTWPAVAS